MTCRDIINIQQFKNILNIRAGYAGLDRIVRWIYFADCLQCVKSEYRMETYIHGGEFVILTNRTVTDDSSILMPLVEQMYEHRISAIGINEGQISEDIVRYCDENNIPLFELKESYPLIDLSQIMCEKLVLEENNHNSAEQLFSSILDAKHLSRDNVMAQARYLNVNLEGSFCVAEFVFRYERKESEGDSFAIGGNIRKIIRSVFQTYIKDEVLMLQQTGSILVLIPLSELNDEMIEIIATRIIYRIRQEYGIIAYAGIGNSKDYLDDVRSSRNEASLALKAASITEGDSQVIFFKNQGIYTIISHVDDDRVLDDYVNTNIGRLIQADEINNGNLCETLETYLQNGCNAKQTAQAMYIHRNTLSYRLKKITEILGCNFDDLDDCLRMKLSFIIRKYRNR